MKPDPSVFLRMRSCNGQVRLKAIAKRGRLLLTFNPLYAADPSWDWWLVVTDDHGVAQPLARRNRSGRCVPFVCGHATAVAAMEALSDDDGRDWWVLRASEWLA